MTNIKHYWIFIWTPTCFVGVKVFSCITCFVGVKVFSCIFLNAGKDFYSYKTCWGPDENKNAGKDFYSYKTCWGPDENPVMFFFLFWPVVKH